MSWYFGPFKGLEFVLQGVYTPNTTKRLNLLLSKVDERMIPLV